jgi:peptidoglycan hydrolase-like protein with peptidoglycan-binding domain
MRPRTREAELEIRQVRYLTKAFTGDWKADVARLGKRVSVDEAASTVGGILLRYPPGPGQMGHIVLCDGRGGTVEAKGRAFGVVADTVHNRSWDTGVLIPGIQYNGNGTVTVIPPADVIYELNGRNMDKGVIIKIQTALLANGFNPGVINDEFGQDTLNAVVQFQETRGLTVDGQVGPETAGALGISLKPDAGALPSNVAQNTGVVLTDKDGKPVASDLSPLLAFILMLLSKEKPMATDPAKPGQTVDPSSVLLLLLLQSLQSGKQPDFTQLLTAVLNGQTPGMGTQPGTSKPASPPASSQGSQAQPQQPPQTVNDLITLLLPFVFQKITGQPLPGTTTAPTQTTGNSGSVMTKPSVQIGAAGFGLASLLQLFGAIAPPFGTQIPNVAPHFDNPALGTAATVIPLLIAGIGATGGWGSLLNIGSSLLQGIASAAANNKPKAPA